MSRPPGGPAPMRWLTPLLVLVLAGCTAADVPPTSDSGDVVSPFADCAALTRPPAASAPPVAADLPDLSLPCFTGGEQVRLTSLRGPAVINLWSSTCAPCREELPLMQELADRTAGRLHVAGVDTFDRRTSGASFAADSGVSFPSLFDPKQQLLTGLGRATLPVTVFLAADGGRFVYYGKALDKPALGELVRTHTGVTVTG